jgi:hypothetical protein
MTKKDILENNIGRLIHSAGPELHLPDEKKAQILVRLTSTGTGQVKDHKQKPIWGIIMRSRISKLAAVAVIIIAAVAGIEYFDRSFTLSTAAWAEMLETMKQMPWVHVTVEIDAVQRRGVQESWTCFDPSIEASQDVDGIITYQDYSTETMHVYDPNSETITIYSTTDKYDLTKPNSPFAMIPEIIKSMREKKAEIRVENAQLDGRKVEVIHAITDIQEFSMVRDLEQNLLISMEVKAALADIAEVMTAKAAFEYPQEGPDSIYELGVPKDAEVIDRRPKGDLRKLTAQVQDHFDNGFGNHIALVLKSYVDESGELEPAEIVVMRKLGPMQRLDSYYAANIERFENLYEEVKDRWPDLTIQDVRELEHEDLMQQQVVFDGEYTTIRFRNSKEDVDTNRHKGKVAFLSPGQTINWIAWVDFRMLNLGRARHQKSLELLAADDEHEGLLGISIYEPEHETLVNMDGRNSVLVGPTIDKYWFDPTRDYVLMEQTHEQEKDVSFTNSKSITLTLEVQQTKSGQWYPSHIRHEWGYTLSERGDYHRTEDSRIVIDTEPIFPEGIFDPDFTFEKR